MVKKLFFEWIVIRRKTSKEISLYLFKLINLKNYYTN